MEPVSHKYRDRIMKMLSLSRGESRVSEHNTYQPGNKDLLPYIDGVVEEHLLPGSEIRHLDHLFELLDAARKGESCLLLLEHYSNFDLPVFHYLLRKSGPRGVEAADALIAIAGIKLNEANPVVLAFTEAYSRVVIYPSRSIEIIKRNLKDPKELVAEVMRSTSVNRAAMKGLAELKTQGKLVLVFPAGTRYRPWDPSSKRGVREIDSYIKSFSRMCLVSINGNILRLNPEGEMEEDLLCQDRVVYDTSPVISCEDFRDHVKKVHKLREDKKQAVVDELMSILDRMHDEVERNRL
jgi:glycerol-3-phosphate O-acyltransferase